MSESFLVAAAKRALDGSLPFVTRLPSPNSVLKGGGFEPASKRHAPLHLTIVSDLV